MVEKAAMRQLSAPVGLSKQEGDSRTERGLSGGAEPVHLCCDRSRSGHVGQRHRQRTVPPQPPDCRHHRRFIIKGHGRGRGLGDRSVEHSLSLAIQDRGNDFGMRARHTLKVL